MSGKGCAAGPAQPWLDMHLTLRIRQSCSLKNRTLNATFQEKIVALIIQGIWCIFYPLFGKRNLKNRNSDIKMAALRPKIRPFKEFYVDYPIGWPGPTQDFVNLK